MTDDDPEDTAELWFEQADQAVWRAEVEGNEEESQ